MRYCPTPPYCTNGTHVVLCGTTACEAQAYSMQHCTWKIHVWYVNDVHDVDMQLGVLDKQSIDPYQVYVCMYVRSKRLGSVEKIAVDRLIEFGHKENPLTNFQALFGLVKQSIKMDGPLSNLYGNCRLCACLCVSFCVFVCACVRVCVWCKWLSYRSCINALQMLSTP